MITYRPKRTYFRAERVAVLRFAGPAGELLVTVHVHGERLYAWSEHGRPLDHPIAHRSTACVRKSLGLLPPEQWQLVSREDLRS